MSDTTAQASAPTAPPAPATAPAPAPAPVASFAGGDGFAADIRKRVIEQAEQGEARLRAMRSQPMAATAPDSAGVQTHPATPTSNPATPVADAPAATPTAPATSTFESALEQHMKAQGFVNINGQWYSTAQLQPPAQAPAQPNVAPQAYGQAQPPAQPPEPRAIPKIVADFAAANKADTAKLTEFYDGVFEMVFGAPPKVIQQQLAAIDRISATLEQQQLASAAQPYDAAFSEVIGAHASKMDANTAATVESAVAALAHDWIRAPKTIDGRPLPAQARTPELFKAYIGEVTSRLLSGRQVPATPAQPQPPAPVTVNPQPAMSGLGSPLTNNAPTNFARPGSLAAAFSAARRA